MLRKFGPKCCEAAEQIMEADIVIVSDHVRICPVGQGFAVMRNGLVYSTYSDVKYAREMAEELAENE